MTALYAVGPATEEGRVTGLSVRRVAGAALLMALNQPIVGMAR